MLHQIVSGAQRSKEQERQKLASVSECTVGSFLNFNQRALSRYGCEFSTKTFQRLCSYVSQVLGVGNAHAARQETMPEWHIPCLAACPFFRKALDRENR
jgi:hypothetical protein